MRVAPESAMPKTAVILTAGFSIRGFPLTSHGEDSDTGNMNKVSLPTPIPAVAGVISQLHEQCGVKDFIIDSHYLAGDVIRVLGHGGRFSRKKDDVRIFHHVEQKLVSTGTAVRQITQSSQYRHLFRAGRPFWVVAGDISFPTLNFSSIQERFAEADRAVLGSFEGSMTFVLRPAEDILKAHPTAVVSKTGRVTEIIEKTDSMAVLENAYGRSSHPFAVKGSPVRLPLDTAIFLVKPEIFRTVPRSEMAEESYDFGKFIFPRLARMGKAYGYVIDDLVKGPVPYYGYHDLGLPESYYRAIYAYVKNAFRKMPGQYDKATNSWIGKNSVVEGTVRNCYIGRNVFIDRSVTLSDSFVFDGSEIYHAAAEGSVILPFSRINCIPGAPAPFTIGFSIVGGKIIGGSAIDHRHLLGDMTGSANSQLILKACAVPNINGRTEVTPLRLTDLDIRQAKSAFSEIDAAAFSIFTDQIADQMTLDFGKGESKKPE